MFLGVYCFHIVHLYTRLLLFGPGEAFLIKREHGILIYLAWHELSLVLLFLQFFSWFAEVEDDIEKEEEWPYRYLKGKI